MNQRKPVKEHLREAIILQLYQSNLAYGYILTYEDINSVLIDILHENNKHEPKEQFKK